MGWGNCGKDRKGRNIGYVFPAKCDQKGCKKERIHRGLFYACGGMHGENDGDCEGYFCGSTCSAWKTRTTGWRLAATMRGLQERVERLSGGRLAGAHQGIGSEDG